MMTAARKQEILDAVMVTNGRAYITGDLVEAGRDPEHPAHPMFEWDDTKAGHAHRLWQERNHVNKLRLDMLVERKEPPPPPTPVAAKLVAPRPKPQRVSIPAWVADGKRRRVRGDSLEGQELLQQEAVKRLGEFRERYRLLLLAAEVDGMAEFIEKKLAELAPPQEEA